MPEETGRRTPFKKIRLSPSAGASAPAPTPPELEPAFTVEYVSPVIWVQPASAWILDFSLANRGTKDEAFAMLTTEFHWAPDQPAFFDPGATVFPGRSFVVDALIEILSDKDDSQGWWARIFASSRNVVPSIHVMGPVATFSSGSPPPPYEEFYISPGDFAVFNVRLGVRLPSVGLEPIE